MFCPHSLPPPFPSIDIALKYVYVCFESWEKRKIESKKRGRDK
jgi:hypothetical protein